MIMPYLIAINFHDQRPSATSTCTKVISHVTVDINLK